MLYVPAWTDEPQFTSVDFKRHLHEKWKKQKKKSKVHFDALYSIYTCTFVILTKVLLSSNLRSKTYGFWLTWFIVVDVSKQKEDYTEGD